MKILNNERDFNFHDKRALKKTLYIRLNYFKNQPPFKMENFTTKTEDIEAISFQLLLSENHINLCDGTLELLENNGSSYIKVKALQNCCFRWVFGVPDGDRWRITSVMGQSLLAGQTADAYARVVLGERVNLECGC